jgi:hypothetical protein
MRDNFQKIKREEEFKGMEVEKCVPVVKASGRYCPKWMNRAAKVARRK